jgi:hypothetical protein
VLASGSVAAARRPRVVRTVSVEGGQTLGRGGAALATGGLFPGVFVEYLTGVDDRADVGVRGDLFWSSPYSAEGFGTGLGVSLPLRLGLARGPHAAVAFRVAPDMVLGRFGPMAGCDCVARDAFGSCIELACDGPARGRPGMGIGCDLGVNVGIPIGNVNVLAGASSPIHYVVSPGRTDLYVPIAPFGGAEVRLANDLNVFGLAQLGTALHDPSGQPTRAETFARLWGGIEVGL